MTVFEDEIDLRPYIFALLRYWWLILLLALIPAVLALVVNLRQPNVFSSTASILLTPSRPSLSIVESFPTVNEPFDMRTRLNAMVAIASSDQVALDTKDALGNALPPELRNRESLKGLVEVTGDGELILVKATSPNAQQAAIIANAWAKQAVEAINLAYSGELPLVDIQSQQLQSQQAYEKAQADLEKFIKNNHIDLLENQIAEAKTVFSRMTGERALTYYYYAQRKQVMEDIRVQAEALKEQISAGSQSNAAGIGDALAVMIARAGAYRSGRTQESFRMNPVTNTETDTNTSTSTENEGLFIGPTPNNLLPDLNLDIQIAQDGSLASETNTYIQDLDQLIRQAEKEQSKAERMLEEISRTILEEQDEGAISAMASRIRELENQLEIEKARELELITLRDTAWTANRALVQKVIEIKSTAQTGNRVNLASLALESNSPAPQGVINNTAIAGFIGLIAGVLFVLAMQWWRSINQPSSTKTSLPAIEISGK